MQPYECFLEIMPLSAAIEAKPEWDSDFTQDVYTNWVSSYVRRSGLYYRMRYQRFAFYVRGLFARDTGIGIDDVMDHDAWELWNAFSEQHNLNHYSVLMNYALSELDDYVEPKDDTTLNYVSSHELLARYMEHMEMVQRGELAADMPFVYQSLWRVWFDYTIDNTPDDIKRLRRISYPDYLKTTHWLRVRTAMLIAHGSRCQSKSCYGHDSYLGDEKWLHIHHVSYKNRGKERFDDLTVLCDQCHKQVHEGEK